MDSTEEALLSVRDVSKRFHAGGMPGKRKYVNAVDGVSLELGRGEVLGIVGESGCGKTTLGRVILRLIDPTSGSVRFDGVDIATLDREEMRLMRKRMQIVFQDPYASLNPRMTVADTLAEPMAIFGIGSKADRKGRVADLLETVGLSADYANRYPHEFSGGQRQRIGIARALAVSPDLVVCDEPVSALDVSVRSQIINLMQDLQAKMGLTYLFISHDLSVVRHISNRVAVMYLGRIVESAQVDELFLRPAHPYTKALLSAVPVPEPGAGRERIMLSGDLPNPIDPPSGCRFRTRCWMACERCASETPALHSAGTEHVAACHFA